MRAVKILSPHPPQASTKKKYFFYIKSISIYLFLKGKWPKTDDFGRRKKSDCEGKLICILAVLHPQHFPIFTKKILADKPPPHPLREHLF